MARTGVTYFDISKAAETIVERGETPTVDKVRAQLGTGSKSTIAPLLKRWRTDSGIIIEPQSGLPSDLLEAVKSLFDRINTALGSTEVSELGVRSERDEGRVLL